MTTGTIIAYILIGLVILISVLGLLGIVPLVAHIVYTLFIGIALALAVNGK